MAAPVLKTYKPKKRFIPKLDYAEDALQRNVCHFLKLQYPHVVFRSDLDSGRAKSSNFQRHRMVAMNSTRAWPDLFIYEPQFRGGTQYAGLALELKREGTTIVTKIGPRKGHLVQNKHIREQFLLLKELKARGYYANFAVGFDDAVRIINWYFGNAEAPNEELPF